MLQRNLKVLKATNQCSVIKRLGCAHYQYHSSSVNTLLSTKWKNVEEQRRKIIYIVNPNAPKIQNNQKVSTAKLTNQKVLKLQEMLEQQKLEEEEASLALKEVEKFYAEQKQKTLLKNNTVEEETTGNILSSKCEKVEEDIGERETEENETVNRQTDVDEAAIERKEAKEEEEAQTKRKAEEEGIDAKRREEEEVKNLKQTKAKEDASATVKYE